MHISKNIRDNDFHDCLKGLLLSLTMTAGSASAATPAQLPALGVVKDDVTVSGLSSGAFMAVQYHVAHSGQVSGAGILAGGPYECATDGFWLLYPKQCMQPDSGHPLPTVEKSIKHVQDDAAAGLIDSSQGLVDDRVWLFSGGNDKIVKGVVMDQLQAFYKTWTNNIEYKKVDTAGHAMISADDTDAKPCDVTEAPYINHCAEADGTAIDAPGLLLSYLLAGEEIKPKAQAGSGELIKFDQYEFNKAAGAFGLDDAGYVFIPTGCREGGCRLHIVFHGCKQSADYIDTTFVKDAGYNRWAESNKIVVLYPQAASRVPLAFAAYFPFVEVIVNPLSCWDWWGYEDDNYATREGRQIKAVNLMASRLAEPVH